MRYVCFRAMMPVLAVLLVACGGDGGNEEPAGDTGATNQPAATQASGTTGGDASTTQSGQITIGGESWSIEPGIQCSVFGGEVVAIAGQAAEDPAVAITLDYDPDSLVAAAVEKPDAFQWRATDDAVTFEIDGTAVRGEGSFSNALTGETADGSFEVTC